MVGFFILFPITTPLTISSKFDFTFVLRMCAQVPTETGEHPNPWNWSHIVIDGWYGCWDSGMSPLHQQQELSITELSLQPLKLFVVKVALGHLSAESSF